MLSAPDLRRKLLRLDKRHEELLRKQHWSTVNSFFVTRIADYHPTDSSNIPQMLSAPALRRRLLQLTTWTQITVKETSVDSGYRLLTGKNSLNQPTRFKLEVFVDGIYSKGLGGSQNCMYSKLS